MYCCIINGIFFFFNFFLVIFSGFVFFLSCINIGAFIEICSVFVFRMRVCLYFVMYGVVVCLCFGIVLLLFCCVDFCCVFFVCLLLFMIVGVLFVLLLLVIVFVFVRLLLIVMFLLL